MATTTCARWSAARSSVHSTVSHLWHSRYPLPGGGAASRGSHSYEVPIYLSETCEKVDHETVGRSPRSTRSIIETATNFVSRIRPLTLRGSSVYSSSPILRRQTHVRDATEENCPGSQNRDLDHSHDHDLDPDLDLENAGSHTLTTSSRTTPDGQVVPAKKPRPRRAVSSLRIKIDTKRRLSVAFGLTMFAALVTCESGMLQLLTVLMRS